MASKSVKHKQIGVKIAIFLLQNHKNCPVARGSASRPFTIVITAKQQNFGPHSLNLDSCPNGWFQYFGVFEEVVANSLRPLTKEKN